MKAKRIIILILLVAGFILLNDRAALYCREITPPVINFIPLGLLVDYDDAKYHLRDAQRMYPIVCSESPFPAMGNHKEIYVKNLNAIYWTKDRIIVDILSPNGQKLIEIEVGTSLINGHLTETHVKEYKFVTNKDLGETKDKVVFSSIPFFVQFWPILGFFYIFGGLIFIGFGLQVSFRKSTHFLL